MKKANFVTKKYCFYNNFFTQNSDPQHKKFNTSFPFLACWFLVFNSLLDETSEKDLHSCPAEFFSCGVRLVETLEISCEFIYACEDNGPNQFSSVPCSSLKFQIGDFCLNVEVYYNLMFEKSSVLSLQITENLNPASPFEMTLRQTCLMKFLS